jgi:hypothetical protein
MGLGEYIYLGVQEKREKEKKKEKKEKSLV